MKVVLFGYEGKVGAIMAAGLEKAGHEVLGVEVGDDLPDGGEAAVDFTQPDSAVGNIERALERGLPVVVGTTGWEGERDRVDALAKERGVAVFVAPNFSIGAVLMMRFAAEAAKHLPRAEIVELHNEAKKDAPSGTARATADGDGRRAADPLRAPARVDRAPGGPARGRGAAADDPPRHAGAGVVRAGRPARTGEAGRVARG